MFSKKALLCVDVLTTIGSVPQGAVLTALTLAERLSISVSHTESVVRLLREAGFVRSVRGPGGGYQIARSPDRITIWEVVSAIDGTEVAEGSSVGVKRATQSLENALGLEVNSFLSKKTIGEFVSSDWAWHVHPVQVRSGFGFGPKPTSLMPVAPNSVFQLSSFLQSAHA